MLFQIGKTRSLERFPVLALSTRIINYDHRTIFVVYLFFDTSAIYVVSFCRRQLAFQFQLQFSLFLSIIFASAFKKCFALDAAWLPAKYTDPHTPPVQAFFYSLHPFSKKSTTYTFILSCSPAATEAASCFDTSGTTKKLQ